MRIDERETCESLDRRVAARVLMQPHPLFDKQLAAMDARREVVLQVINPSAKLATLIICGRCEEDAQITRQEAEKKGARANTMLDVQLDFAHRRLIGSEVIRDLASKLRFHGHGGTISRSLVLTDYSHAHRQLGG